MVGGRQLYIRSTAFNLTETGQKLLKDLVTRMLLSSFGLNVLKLCVNVLAATMLFFWNQELISLIAQLPNISANA